MSTPPPVVIASPSMWKKWVIVFAALLIAVIVLLSFPRHATSSKPAIPKITRISVTAQTLGQSRSVRETLSFPALIVSQQEAKVVAKSSGTVQEAKAQLGDFVSEGDLLLTIDDSSGNASKAGPVSQAKLVSEQAGVAYHLAQTNYENTLDSSQKDLRQAEISRDQAQTGKLNTQSITDEALKTAQLAVEQARLALEDRKQTATQTEGDTRVNASVVAESALNASQSVLAGINSITGFDENNSVVVPYDIYLGYYSQTRIDAKAQYKTAKADLAEFDPMQFPTLSERIQKTLLIAQEVRDLADRVKELLDRYTVTGSVLPLTSATGPSLTAFQSAVAGYQTQINGAIAQLNGAKQALDNVSLGNQTSLDALQKAYDMALQNFESLKATSSNQIDQAGFGQYQAENQVENLKIKLDSQVAAAKAQMDSAKIQYENSLVGLNSLSGNYQIAAPINGVVTRKLFSIGDTAAPGQLLMTVSRPDLIKIQFFVDQEALPYIKADMVAHLKVSNETVVDAKITSVSTRADEQSKRFMVEAEPASGTLLSLGTVADITVDLDYKSKDPSHFMLPLSAIDVGQNGSQITLAQDGRASKTEAEIIHIVGEAAEIAALVPTDALIIVDGNRLAQEGDFLTISNFQIMTNSE